MGRRDVAHDGGVLFCRPRVHLVSGEAFVDGDRSIDVGWDDDESVNLDMNSLIAQHLAKKLCRHSRM